MAQQARFNMTVYRGDSKKWRLQAHDITTSPDGTVTKRVQDLTDIDITAQVRVRANDPDTWHDLTVNKVDPVAGVFEIVITASESAQLSDPDDPTAPYAGFWDLQFANGEAVWTPVVGSFTVTADVTRV